MRSGAVMDRSGLVLGLLGLLSAACGFDASGVGTSGGGMVAHDTDTSSTMGESRGSMDAESGDTTSSRDTTSGSAGDADGSGSEGPNTDPCADPAPFTVEINATHALLEPPMQSGTSMTEGAYVYSEASNSGRASFQFQLPCAAEVRAWARVYDPGVGASAVGFGDPDSYLVAFDGDEPKEWWYGCQTIDAGPYAGAWAWANMIDNPWCVESDFRRTLSSGTHLLHLTNREPGDQSSGYVAAVARVVITTDPAYSP